MQGNCKGANPQRDFQHQDSHLGEVDFQGALVANPCGSTKNGSCCVDDKAGDNDGVQDPIGRSWQKGAYQGAF